MKWAKVSADDWRMADAGGWVMQRVPTRDGGAYYALARIGDYGYYPSGERAAEAILARRFSDRRVAQQTTEEGGENDNQR